MKFFENFGWAKKENDSEVSEQTLEESDVISEYEEKRRELIRKLEETYSDPDESEAKLNEYLIPFQKKLKAAYGDECEKYKFYHLLLGSSPYSQDPDRVSKFDFEVPEYSVRNFIDNLVVPQEDK